MYQLKLNNKLICEGEAKSLNALFNDLSGLSFARTKNQASWLDKMSATESYETYLHIKASEYNLDTWEGQLTLLDDQNEAERVHFFDTHAEIHNKRRAQAS